MANTHARGNPLGMLCALRRFFLALGFQQWNVLQVSAASAPSKDMAEIVSLWLPNLLFSQ